MRLRDRLTFRFVRVAAYYGIVKHPYGREYARQQYTPLGGQR